jgi:membrane-bound lytic murein transglycosylase D
VNEPVVMAVPLAPPSLPTAVEEADPIEIAMLEPIPAPGPESEAIRSSVVIPKADPSDYAVTSDGRITVQAAETLGHYADWLEIPTNRLRRLNRMSFRTPVTIGRRTKLDFSKVSAEQFEQRRLEYHHTLQEEYFDAFEVTGTDFHVLRSGDTLWQLAEVRYKLPVWLLRQYNPTLDFGALQSGTRMVIPVISPREGRG